VICLAPVGTALGQRTVAPDKWFEHTKWDTA
jgi:hypothetical protein